MYLIQMFLLSLLVLCSSCNNKVSNTSITTTVEPEPAYFWSDLESDKDQPECEGRIMPLKYRLMKTDYVSLRKLLLKGSGNKQEGVSDTTELLIPLPDGSWELFHIFPVEVMAPELAEKFPEIRTYAGFSAVNASDNIRLDISPRGFSSMILSERGTMMVDPFCRNDTVHVISYNRNDLPPDSKQPFEE